MRKSTEPSPADSGDEDLRGQLAREKEVRERVTKEKDDLLLVVEGLQGKVSELNRRHADATRAYEQEKRVSYYSVYSECTMCPCVGGGGQGGTYCRAGDEH